jgi:uncharacterized protein YijF (DUF1287 family)
MKRKRKIRWRNLLLVSAVSIGSLALLGFGYQNLVVVSYTNDDFNIETYVSGIDLDSDGVDDQTDILSNVKEYIKTKPKYKSKYYAGGYSDDEYGVCTDLVAVGLLGAGYDLMELVHQDIMDHRSEYAIDTVDQNIDFKRVVNLRVYLKRHATQLTNDIYEIDQWQGGDLIVFEKHIGIVSDKRNKEGVPFIIHHASTFQKRYEQDIVETMAEVVGHYRMS